MGQDRARATERKQTRVPLQSNPTTVAELLQQAYNQVVKSHSSKNNAHGRWKTPSQILKSLQGVSDSVCEESGLKRGLGSIICRKRRKGCIICTVQRDRQKAKLQGRQQLAMPILSANPFWEKAACTYNSLRYVIARGGFRIFRRGGHILTI